MSVNNIFHFVKKYIHTKHTHVLFTVFWNFNYNTKLVFYTVVLFFEGRSQTFLPHIVVACVTLCRLQVPHSSFPHSLWFQALESTTTKKAFQSLGVGMMTLLNDFIYIGKNQPITLKLLTIFSIQTLTIYFIIIISKVEKSLGYGEKVQLVLIFVYFSNVYFLFSNTHECVYIYIYVTYTYINLYITYGPTLGLYI